MSAQGKTKEEFISDLQKLLKENKSLRLLKGKRAEELVVANKELVFQNKEKEKRAAELIFANKELANQYELKEKRADELIIANKELVFQNREKEKRAAELKIANLELAYQFKLKEKRAAELIIANKELAYQFKLKEKRATELLKAEESDRLKSAFLANMSHEIRTPMNGVLGFAELLKRKNISEEKREKYLDLIAHEGARLLNIINDIVDISKIDSKLVAIDISSCNVNSLIDDLYSKYSISTKSSNIILKATKGLKDVDSTIKTDSNRLVQILSNLIENAIKFTEKGSVEFGYTLDSNELLFYVKDSGPGIAIEDQLQIFGRFNQSKKHSTHDSGSGLGLSISKGLAELLGGEIWVESKINNGATFFVKIPYSNIISETKLAIENSNTSLINKKEFVILIAEDEYIIYLFLKECFSDINCSILHAPNGKVAVQLLAENPSIDFILMDINMPYMDGYEALKEIRKINKVVPVIAQSGLAMSGDKEKILEAGFNDYVSKPISMDLLITIINKHLKN
jgi:signal transduction histidine kinase/CheY-like chemotaxis protein